MPSIHSTEQQIADLKRAENQGAIVMLNLLRYREHAEYSAGTGEPTRSGREAFAVYGKHARECIRNHGGRIVFSGKALATVIAPADETWDDVILVEYPSRDAFLSMLETAAYRAIAHHRTAALADSRLIALETPASS